MKFVTAILAVLITSVSAFLPNLRLYFPNVRPYYVPYVRGYLPYVTGNVPSYITKDNSPAPNDPAFINKVLQTVNGIRAQHGAAALTWDPVLAEVTLRKSNGCTLNHTGIYGENAFTWWTYPANMKPDFDYRIGNAFDSWTSQTEVNAYLRGDFRAAGHFTQTVWKSSERIGCAFSTIQCKNNADKEWWFYCDFDPPGNYNNLYAQNVQL